VGQTHPKPKHFFIYLLGHLRDLKVVCSHHFPLFAPSLQHTENQFAASILLKAERIRLAPIPGNPPLAGNPSPPPPSFHPFEAQASLILLLSPCSLSITAKSLMMLSATTAN
jgi:hypothetical protein